jgi:nucleotidyltransferase/DNA polymerase involved in DNA repair
MSFACIHVPDFPLQAAIRIDEEVHEQAVAILDGTFPLLTIIALSPKAIQKGLHIGMTKTQAELFDVKLLHRSLAQETAAHQALLDCALAISPRVEDTHGPPNGIGDTVILDTGGLERLYRSPEKITQRIRRLAQQLNLDVNIGIAENPEAALLAARGFSGITIIPPGCESKSLGPLPIGILPISSELQETFEIWGIHTFQALSVLPEVGLVKRLGQEGKRLQDLARGMHRRILVPLEPELKFEESMELEAPLELLEPLTFILARLLKQLCTRLLARSLATDKVKLILELEVPSPVISQDKLLSLPPTCFPSPCWGGGNPPQVPPWKRRDHRGVVNSLAPVGGEDGRRPGEGAIGELSEFVYTFPRQGGTTVGSSPLRHSTVLSLPVPTRDSKVLLKLFQLELESHLPEAPVRSIFLKAAATSPRTAQRELFLPSGPEPEKLEITLAKISAVVGRDRVGSPVLLNTHKPDSFQLKKFLVPAAANGSRKSAKNPFCPGGQAPEGSHEKISYRGGRSPLTPGPSPRWGEGHPPQAPPWKRGDHRGVVNSLAPNAGEGARRAGEGEAITPYSSLRRFRPPITARVRMKDAVPVSVFFHNERRTILHYAGPWRTNGDWWTNTQWTREEWDITLLQRSCRTAQTKPFQAISTQETAAYRIYQDLQTRQWFVEGIYD